MVFSFGPVCFSSMVYFQNYPLSKRLHQIGYFWVHYCQVQGFNQKIFPDDELDGNISIYSIYGYQRKRRFTVRQNRQVLPSLICLSMINHRVLTDYEEFES